MGADRGSAFQSGHLIRVAQVVPSVPSFAVDDGFTYAVPDTVGEVEVGSMVRVPLGGRVVRGFVTSVGSRDDVSALRPIKAVSGDLPVFDRRLLETVRWAATHYVAPLSTVLGRCAPPNLPRLSQPVVPETREGGNEERPAAAMRLLERPGRVQYRVAGRDHEAIAAEVAGPILHEGRNVLALAPTVLEAEAIHAVLRERFGARALLATSSLPASHRSNVWSIAQRSGGVVLVGTREIVFWPAGGIAGALVVEDGRRGMKSPSTPTIHVREVLRRRAAVERFGLLLSGPVPTAEALAVGTGILESPGRVWPVVEVVDRVDDPPGAGSIAERTRAALTAVARRGGRAFVLVGRRGYAPAFRCVRCGTMRKCLSCGSSPGRGETCQRCSVPAGPCANCRGVRFAPLGAGVGRIVDDLRRSLGHEVGTANEGVPLIVGTERDLVFAAGVDLAVAIDADAAILAPHYRAGEDALRLLARLALTVEPGPGRRAMVQTALPRHPVIEALRSGRPLPYMRTVVAERGATGFPPAGDLIAVAVADGDDVDGRIRRAVAEDGEVLGPAAAGDSRRWLIQGADLSAVRIRLRTTVHELRASGARVRIDVDPIDL